MHVEQNKEPWSQHGFCGWSHAGLFIFLNQPKGDILYTVHCTELYTVYCILYTVQNYIFRIRKTERKKRLNILKNILGRGMCICGKTVWMTLNCYKPKKEKLNLLRERIIVYQQKSYNQHCKNYIHQKINYNQQCKKYLYFHRPIKHLSKKWRI